MALVLVATPGSATANSYETKAEADAYFESRLPLTPPWEDADYPEAALVMATRVVDMVLQPSVTFDMANACYRTRSTWTGTPATATQRLAWPRIGMFSRNGNAIPSGEIPYELKEAVAELAGQLLVADRTLDNDVSVQGITSIKAGSVSLSFKDVIESKVLPDAVLTLMPPSWFTDEDVDYGVRTAMFEVI